jgi:hypothetical protein
MEEIQFGSNIMLMVRPSRMDDSSNGQKLDVLAKFDVELGIGHGEKKLLLAYYPAALMLVGY